MRAFTIGADERSPFNGVRVTRGRGTIFVPLPPEAWTPLTSCGCQECVALGSWAFPAWDTVAVAERAGERARLETSWAVHPPELHLPDARVREAVRRRGEELTPDVLQAILTDYFAAKRDHAGVATPEQYPLCSR